jgi:hypothetical protein
MYTRLFFGEIQQGKAEEAWQILQSGNEIVGITSWQTQQDLASYAEGELARELFRRITPLFMGMPTVRTFEVRLNLADPAALKPA